MPFQSTGQLAQMLGVQSWQIARLFELGVVRETQRIAGRRMIPCTMVPEIVTALTERGWLPAEDSKEHLS